MFIFFQNGMSALMQAAYKARTDMCQFLLSRGADVNATCHDNQYTPLMMACLSGISNFFLFDLFE